MIELHKAKEMESLIRDSMSLLDKVNMNVLIKSSVKTDLNKCLQHLSYSLKKEEVKNGI